jgi:hypothetical protein
MFSNIGGLVCHPLLYNPVLLFSICPKSWKEEGGKQTLIKMAEFRIK